MCTSWLAVGHNRDDAALASSTERCVQSQTSGTLWQYTHMQITRQVRTCTPARPYMCRSPAKEPRQPVKEKKGSGTGMGTLMPTCSEKRPNVHAACMLYLSGASGVGLQQQLVTDAR